MARRVRARHTVGGDLIKGAIAGAVATFVMGKVTSYMYEHQDRDVRRREDEAREGRSAYETAAEKAAAAAGTTLRVRQRQDLGSAIHWTLGIGAGAVYAVLRRRVQVFRHLESQAGEQRAILEFEISRVGPAHPNEAMR